MENNENSEARFAEIKTAVGNPFEVPPSVYMQRLEEETKRDNSLVPFLSKASRVDTTPRQSPKEWLEKLATTDFRLSSDTPFPQGLCPSWNRRLSSYPGFTVGQVMERHFPTVNDWIQSYGNVDRTKPEESIKATCITGAVEVKEIPLVEAEELFRQ
ncbi:hypothetical protein FOFC_07334 [Fusarium oxysporum]|nr:hypothetical protein FOFC_07334 [Fusarium oxysporum]